MRFNPRLLMCISKGANDEAKSLIQEIPCNAVDDSGLTLLHYAVKYRNAEIMKHLLEEGCDVDAQNSDGYTPLSLAVDNYDVATIEVLLKNDADIYFAKESGVSILQSVVNSRLIESEVHSLKQNSHLIFEMFFKVINEDFSKNQDEVTSFLLESDNLMKLVVVAYGSVELAKFMLENGYPVNLREPKNNMTALHWAVVLKKLENVKLLIEHGANSNLRDASGHSPFYYYYTENFESLNLQLETLKIFLKASWTSATDKHDREVAKRDSQYLLTKGDKETVKTVIKANVEVTTMIFSDGRSLLHLLMDNKNTEVLDLLVELRLNLDVNGGHFKGGTPLLVAASSGCLKKVEFLLKLGADMNSTTPEGLPVLFVACAAHYLNKSEEKEDLVKIIELLLCYGAKDQFVLRGGKTILDYIYSTDKGEILTRILVAHFAWLIALDQRSITNLIRRKIESDLQLKVYYQLCVQQLEEMKNIEVYDKISLFDLLNEVDVKKVMIYARNEQFLSAFNSTLEKFSHLQPHYLSVLEIRMKQALDKIEFHAKAAAAIEMLTGLCSVAHHVVLGKVMSYLSFQDLQSLCKIENLPL